MEPKKTVCVDLDGVLAEYYGWQGLEHIGRPTAGAHAIMAALRTRYRVVVFTTRCKLDDMDRPDVETAETLRDRVVNWLNLWAIPFDDVYAGQGKPMAAAYLDDRAVGVPSNPNEGDAYAAVAGVFRIAG